MKIQGDFTVSKGMKTGMQGISRLNSFVRKGFFVFENVRNRLTNI